jgi:CheY-like chemotaxis protein
MTIITFPAPRIRGGSKKAGKQPGHLIPLKIWREKMKAHSKGVKPRGGSRIKTAAEEPFHILLAEDDREMRGLLSQAFRKAGYAVTECSDGVGLLTHLESFLFPEKGGKRDVDLIVSDIRMPGFTGMEVLEGTQSTGGFPPMVLITAFGDYETHAQAERYGAAAMFDKPFDIDDLLDKVRKLLPRTRKPRGISD